MEIYLVCEHTFEDISECVSSEFDIYGAYQDIENAILKANEIFDKRINNDDMVVRNDIKGFNKDIDYIEFYSNETDLEEDICACSIYIKKMILE